MLSDNYFVLGAILLGTIITLFVIEVIFSITWNRIYFLKGFAIFVSTIRVGPHHENIPSTIQLNAQFHSWWSHSIVFKELAPDTYGFREKVSEIRWIRYMSPMHGVMAFDRNNGRLVVKGLINWGYPYFSLLFWGIILFVFVSKLLSGQPVPGTVFMMIFTTMIVYIFVTFVVPYWIASFVYTRIASFAAQTWSRQYQPT